MPRDRSHGQGRHDAERGYFLARKNWFCNMLFPAEIIPPCQKVVSHAGPCHAPSHAQVLAHTEPDDCMLLSI